MKFLRQNDYQRANRSQRKQWNLFIFPSKSIFKHTNFDRQDLLQGQTNKLYC